jgi:hypothetical protein
MTFRLLRKAARAAAHPPSPPPQITTSADSSFVKLLLLFPLPETFLKSWNTDKGRAEIAPLYDVKISTNLFRFIPGIYSIREIYQKAL